MTSLLFYLKVKLLGFKLDDVFTSDIQLESEEESRLLRYERIADDLTPADQIQNCLRGKKYYILDDEGNENWQEPVTEDEFIFYYDLYDLIEIGGWPNNKGWFNELEWIVQIYRNFKRTAEQIENILELKAIENGKNTVRD